MNALLNRDGMAGRVPGGSKRTGRSGAVWAVAGAAAVLTVAAGCSSSSAPKASASSSTSASTTASTTAPAPPSTAGSAQSAAKLTGTHSIDIHWNMNPQVGVPCPAGLTGFCTRNKANGSDATLGSLSLDEFLATPSSNSCTTGTVQGHFTLADAAQSDMTYTGSGQFCWSSITGTFNLTLGHGTGQLSGATGKLVAKISSSGDEWTGTLTFAG